MPRTARRPVRRTVGLGAAALVLASLLAGCGATVDGTPSGPSGSGSASAPSSGSMPSVPAPFATGGASLPSGGGTQADTQYFTLTLPPGWRSTTDGLENGIVAVFLGPSSDGFTTNTNMAREFVSGVDLDNYRARTLANLQTQLPITDLSETRSLTVDGEPAVTYDFRSTVRNTPFKQGQVVVIHDGYGYVFTYSASLGTYDRFAGEAASMITSLRWR